MVTCHTTVPGWNVHSINPIRLRGISGQRLVSRFDLNPETRIVTQLRFASDSARKILCRATHSIDDETGEFSLEPRQRAHAIAGPGRVSFLRASSGDAAQTHRMAVAILIMATCRDLGLPLDRMRSGPASP